MTGSELTPRQRWDLVRGSNIQPSLRLTLYALHCTQGEGRTAFCKRETLAAEVGIHVDQLSRKLKELEALKVITSIWTKRRGRPSREHSINYARLRELQRPTLTDSSDCDDDTLTISSESTLTDSSVPLCGFHQSHSDEFIRHEDPLNIQGKSTLRNSPNSRQSSRKKSGQKAEAALREFCTRWNEWHSAGLVTTKIQNPDSPGKTITEAWNRGQRDEEQRQRIADFETIHAAIAASREFLNGKAFFDAAGLAGGKNPNKRWYAEQLVSGVYRSERPGGSVNEAQKAWDIVSKSAHQFRWDGTQFKAAIGPKPLAILKAMRIDAKAINEATDFEKRDFQKRFIQEFNGGQDA